MRILDARVGTEAACRGKAVRGIPRQENTAVAKAFGDLRRSCPESYVDQFNGEVWDTYGAACQFQASPGRKVLCLLPGCRLERSYDQPPVCPVCPQQGAVAASGNVAGGEPIADPRIEF